MRAISTFLRSSIGRKMLMALTGLGLILFVIAHLLGNLSIFMGPEAINAYAHKLISLGPLLWVARIGLLVLFLVHLALAFSLTASNRSARPSKYKKRGTVQATPASLYMMETGIVILIFVIVHLLHFTLGVLDPENHKLVDSAGRHDVYSMIVLGFQNPAYVIFYLLAMVALGVHLRHAFQSCFQTLGFNHSKYTPTLKQVAPVLAVLLAAGYSLIPIGVVAGVLAPVN